MLPQRMSYDDVADQLSTLLGQSITHDKITVDEQEAILVRLGLPSLIQLG